MAGVQHQVEARQRAGLRLTEFGDRRPDGLPGGDDDVALEVALLLAGGPDPGAQPLEIGLGELAGADPVPVAGHEGWRDPGRPGDLALRRLTTELGPQLLADPQHGRLRLHPLDGALGAPGDLFS